MKDAVLDDRYPEDPGFKEVQIWTVMNSWNWPEYSLTVSADGKLDYHGKKHVIEAGKRSWKVSRFRLLELSYLLDEFEEFEMEEYGEPGWGDLPWVCLLIQQTDGSISKKIYKATCADNMIDFHELVDRCWEVIQAKGYIENNPEFMAILGESEQLSVYLTPNSWVIAGKEGSDNKYLDIDEERMKRFWTFLERCNTREQSDMISLPDLLPPKMTNPTYYWSVKAKYNHVHIEAEGHQYLPPNFRQFLRELEKVVGVEFLEEWKLQ